MDQNFEIMARRRLQHERYLNQNGNTLDSIVKKQVAKFETDGKRDVDLDWNFGCSYEIPGLIKNGDKRFAFDCMLMDE